MAVQGTSVGVQTLPPQAGIRQRPETQASSGGSISPPTGLQIEPQMPTDTSKGQPRPSPSCWSLQGRPLPAHMGQLHVSTPVRPTSPRKRSPEQGQLGLAPGHRGWPLGEEHKVLGPNKASPGPRVRARNTRSKTHPCPEWPPRRRRELYFSLRIFIVFPLYLPHF